jgi:homoserine dehydrogenase
MKEINIALLGFGNVGRAFLRYLEKIGDSQGLKINIRAIADSSGALLMHTPELIHPLLDHKESGRSLKEFAPAEVVSDARQLIEACRLKNISCIVESLPTNITNGQPALDWLTQALLQGVQVVTVDKGPVVYGYEALKNAAEIGDSRFAFTGTTGVAVPQEIVNDKVLEIRGVLNGTTNYILTAMQEQNLSFDEALAVAQGDGIAEPDPSLDVKGWDTACKILILAKALMKADATLAQVSRIGISQATQSLIDHGRATNRLVRLVGRARIWQGRVRVSVAPKLLDKESPFYAVSGTSKAAFFTTAERGEVLSLARSGRDAISQTILEDVLSVAGGR